MDEKKRRQGEQQYEDTITVMRERGPEHFGLMTGWAWHDDPKRLVFTLARYKFVAKMIEGADSVLEAGCGDGLVSRVVAQAVKQLTAIDFDPEYLESAVSIASDRYPINFILHNLLEGPIAGHFSAVYALDVLEHIDKSQEDLFLTNLILPLDEHGTCIIGMPSLESQVYASKYSKLGHVNCKDQPTFKALMKKYFYNVFMFSMNDEVVHTGFSAMSHYNLALCTGKRPMNI